MSYVQEMVAYEGKVFQVNLQSMLGSSPYGWALSSLPEGIVLESVETSRLPGQATVRPVVQSFYFGIVAVKTFNVKLEFVLLCSFEPKKIVDSCTVNLRIVPEDASQFVTYSDNAQAAVPNTQLEYGFPCATQDSALYGFNCTQPPVVRRGDDQKDDDENIKVAYGFPCTCAVPTTALDYGLPDTTAGRNANNAMPYGFVNAPTHKYGYPCVMQNNLLYGMSFDCVNSIQNQAVDTPFFRKAAPPAPATPSSPFVTDTQMKYGYPTCQ